MTTTRSVLLGTLFGLLVTLGYACGTGPVPVPDPPVPPEPADQRFAGFHDCTDLDTAPAAALVATCGDVENTGGCMAMYLEQGQPAALLICAARDVESAGFVRIAQGTAGPELTARAQRLRAWLAGTNATLRGSP